MTVLKPEMPIHANGSKCSFGPFCLYPDGTLFRETVQVRLAPKELAVLRLLISNAGQIVSAEQLQLSVWGDVHVSADSLPRCVSSLRARLNAQDCIQTIYKRGYRFQLPVKQVSPEPPREREIERRTIRPISPPRLAVLPFTTSVGVPEFLGSGISEETMLRLAHTHNPVVDLVARDSVFNLADRGATAREVGAALGADLSLTGTITALPRCFRLRTEMIRVSDAVQLWVEDFMVPHHLFSEADSRVAKSITARIRNTYTVSAAPAIASLSAEAFTSTPEPMVPRSKARRGEAYTIYLEACAKWNTLERLGMQDAIRGFQHVLDLDASMLEARVHLVHGYLSLSSYGYMRADIAAELARKNAEFVLALSPGEQSMYPALGWIYFHHDRDLAAAADAYARPKHPGYNPWALIYEVRFALGQGRFREAISLLRSALDTDPYSPVLHGRLAWALHLAGEQHAAVKQAKRTLELFPGHSGAMFFCAIVFAAASKLSDSSNDLGARATALATKLIQDSPAMEAGYATLAYAQARQGNLTEARTQLDRQQWMSRERYDMRSFHAPALVELGEFDAAIEALSTAEHQHCPWFFELLHDPRLQPLHGEPEFQRLRRLFLQMTSADASVA